MSFINVYFEGKKYVIDKEKFKKETDYLLTNDAIHLPLFLDDCVSLDITIVNKFINYFEQKVILFSKYDAVALDLLAKIFQVKSLQNLTDSYIQNNAFEIVRGFFEKYNGKINKVYEELIAQVLTCFLIEPKLLQLSLISIHHIIESYASKNTMNIQVVNFLFKYFDVHGTSCSILFSFVERLLNDDEEDYFLNALFLNYKDTFNFGFLHRSHYLFLFENYMEISIKYHSIKFEYEELINTLYNLAKERRNNKT